MVNAPKLTSRQLVQEGEELARWAVDTMGESNVGAELLLQHPKGFFLQKIDWEGHLKGAPRKVDATFAKRATGRVIKQNYVR